MGMGWDGDEDGDGDWDDGGKGIWIQEKEQKWERAFHNYIICPPGKSQILYVRCEHHGDV